MRRGYQTKRQYERSLYREPYLAQSTARGYEARKGREQNAQSVPTDPTNPAAVLRALVLQQPVERTPDGLRVSNQPSALPDKCGGFVPTPDPADAPCADCPGDSPDCQRGGECCDPGNQPQEARD